MDLGGLVPARVLQMLPRRLFVSFVKQFQIIHICMLFLHNKTFQQLFIKMFNYERNPPVAYGVLGIYWSPGPVGPRGFKSGGSYGHRSREH